MWWYDVFSTINDQSDDFDSEANGQNNVVFKIMILHKGIVNKYSSKHFFFLNIQKKKLAVRQKNIAYGQLQSSTSPHKTYFSGVIRVKRTLEMAVTNLSSQFSLNYLFFITVTVYKFFTVHLDFKFYKSFLERCASSSYSPTRVIGIDRHILRKILWFLFSVETYRLFRNLYTF